MSQNEELKYVWGCLCLLATVKFSDEMIQNFSYMAHRSNPLLLFSNFKRKAEEENENI